MAAVSILHSIFFLSIIVAGVWCAELIAGGSLVAPDKLPYQISLRRLGSHFCGGSIIGNRHILTAARCVNGLDAPYNDVAVVSGTNSLLIGGQTHKIQAIRCHPEYVGTREASWVNDIAVIALEEPIVFDSAQGLIELASDNPPVDAPVTISGWGKTSTTGPLSLELLRETQFVESNTQCQSTHTERIYDSQMCALNKSEIGACIGDEGGPLTYNGQLVGVLSWVDPYAVGISDVYTRVPSHLAFIRSTMNSI